MQRISIEEFHKLTGQSLRKTQKSPGGFHSSPRANPMRGDAAEASKPNNNAIKKRAQALGQAWEMVIKTDLENAEKAFMKTEPGFVRYKGSWIPARCGDLDWVMSIGGGQSAHFDTKATEAIHWNIPHAMLEPTRNRPEGSQLTAGKRWAKDGHPVFALVARVEGLPTSWLQAHEILKAGATWTTYVVPITAEGLCVKNRARVQWDAMERWRVPSKTSWMDALANWEDYVKNGWS